MVANGVETAKMPCTDFADIALIEQFSSMCSGYLVAGMRKERLYAILSFT